MLKMHILKVFYSGGGIEYSLKASSADTTRKVVVA